MSLSADLQQIWAPNSSEKNRLEDIKTALALKMTASRQLISSYVKEGQESVVDKVAFNAESRKYRAGMGTKLDQLRASLEKKIQRANEEKK